MRYSRQATRLFIQTVPTPAPGTEWTLRPLGQGGILIQTLTFRLTASAAIPVRTPTLVATDGNTPFWRGQAPAVVAPAAVVTYGAYDGAFPNTGAGGLVTLGWPNQGLWLPQGYSLSSLTTNLDVADQYDQINAFVQELPSGPDALMLPVELMYAEPLDD